MRVVTILRGIRISQYCAYVIDYNNASTLAETEWTEDCEVAFSAAFGYAAVFDAGIMVDFNIENEWAHWLKKEGVQCRWQTTK